MGNSELSSSKFTYDHFLSNFEAISKLMDENYGEGTLLLEKSKQREVFLKEEISMNVEDYKKKLLALKAKPMHPNIVSLLGYFSKSEDKFCSRFFKCLLVFEFHRKTLSDEFQERKIGEKHYYTEKELWHMVSCLIFALSHLQQLKVSHGDLNPTSVLIDNDGVYKILNPTLFGTLSSFTNVLLNNLKKEIYLSPALMKAVETNDWTPDHNPYKSDVFCLGLTILAAASLENVGKALNFHKLVIYDDFIRDLIDGLRERYSNCFLRFLQDMLILNEEKRPDFIRLRQKLESVNVNATVKDSVKTSSDSTIFPFSEKKNYVSGETNTKIPKILSNQRISTIKKADDSEEERPFSVFDAKKSVKTVGYESENFMTHASPNAFTEAANYNSYKDPAEQRKSFEREKIEFKSDKKHEIEQDLESINVILDRYGISPISRLSLGGKNSSYYLKLGKERKEESLNNETQSRKRTMTFNNKAPNNQVHQNTDKTSYLLSQDFELARPYELEPNYRKYEIVIENYADRSRYEGEKIDDKRTGKGKMFYPDGTSYEGSWKADKREGLGVVYSKENQEIYRGDFKDDVFHGNGRYVNISPKMLLGSFDSGDFSKLGDYWVVYEGEFCRGLKEGNGVLILSNGEKFEGRFRDGMVEGKGRFLKSDGKVIEGFWFGNKRKH